MKTVVMAAAMVFASVSGVQAADAVVPNVAYDYHACSVLEEQTVLPDVACAYIFQGVFGKIEATAKARKTGDGALIEDVGAYVSVFKHYTMLARSYVEWTAVVPTGGKASDIINAELEVQTRRIEALLASWQRDVFQTAKQP